jgi:hypothetical protein
MCATPSARVSVFNAAAAIYPLQEARAHLARGACRPRRLVFNPSIGQMLGHLLYRLGTCPFHPYRRHDVATINSTVYYPYAATQKE